MNTTYSNNIPTNIDQSLYERNSVILKTSIQTRRSRSLIHRFLSKHSFTSNGRSNGKKKSNFRIKKQKSEEDKNNNQLKKLDSIEKGRLNLNKYFDTKPQRVSVHVESKKGFIPNETKQNQDSHLIRKYTHDGQDYHIFGIFDGHGKSGAKVSLEVRNMMEQELIKLISTNLIFDKRSIVCVFKRIQKRLIKKNIDTKLSGTTAIICILVNSTIIEINLGDSQYSLYGRESFTYNMVFTSELHNFNNQKELDRVKAFPCSIRPIKDKNGELVGEKRIWMIDSNLPGLLMSRSLGDELAHSIGVTEVPGKIKRNTFQEDRKKV